METIIDLPRPLLSAGNIFLTSGPTWSAQACFHKEIWNLSTAPQQAQVLANVVSEIVPYFARQRTRINGLSLVLRGYPFMTFTKKSGFWPPPPVHMGRTPSPLWTSTHGRHEIHTALLKWLVLSWNDLLDLKLKFNCMILNYLNCTISNLYH